MIGYDDIVVRDTFEEISTGKSDRAGSSVDIIPYGQEILTWDTAMYKYDEVLCDKNSSVITKRTCNCYIRGMNTASRKATSGTAQLFLMPFNVFTNPRKWYSLMSYNSHVGKNTPLVPMISRQKGQISQQIGPGEVCINENAFLLNDSYNLKAGAHYCLCAVVNTPEHSIKIPGSFNSNVDVDKWVTDNHNVSLLNVRPVDMKVKQTGFSFDFGNFDPVKANFALVLQFGCNYNKGEVWSGELPVRVQCTDNRCLFDYKDLRIQHHQEGALFQTITVRINNVPANFYGKCSVYIDNVVPLPDHGFVKLDYYQVVKDIPKEYECERHRFLPMKEEKGHTLFLGSCDVYNSGMRVEEYYQLAKRQQ